MEVLRESLKPSISGSILHWSPPNGYALLDSTPKSIGTFFTGTTHTVFALLKRTHAPRSSGVEVGNGGVAITGQAGNQQVKVDVKPVFLPQLMPTQIKELATIVDKTCVWSKMCDIEMQLMSNSRKNSQNERALEPEPKRIKLNGFNHNSEMDKMVNSDLSDELIRLSLTSGIPCELTCFGDESGQVFSIPPNRQAMADTSINSPNLSRTVQLQKMMNRNKRRLHNHNKSTAVSPSPLSVMSLTKSALTAVGSTLKTMASSFGLVFPDQVRIENGQRIEDHLELEHQKKSSLYWDESKEKLIYSSAYYCSQSEQTAVAMTTPTITMPSPISGSSPSVTRKIAKSTETHSVSTDSSSSDDEDFPISDTESNTSLDPDWDDLRRPAELRPLIQMQLFTGAWPMVRAFSYAVGVPLEEVRKLIMKHDVMSDRPPRRNGVCQLAVGEEEEEDKCNVWTAALAIACLEEYFAPFKVEWEIVVLKGQRWIEQNIARESRVSAGELASIAKNLVSKWA